MGTILIMGLILLLMGYIIYLIVKDPNQKNKDYSEQKQKILEDLYSARENLKNCILDLYHIHDTHGNIKSWELQLQKELQAMDEMIEELKNSKLEPPWVQPRYHYHDELKEQIYN